MMQDYVRCPLDARDAITTANAHINLQDIQCIKLHSYSQLAHPVVVVAVMLKKVRRPIILYRRTVCASYMDNNLKIYKAISSRFAFTDITFHLQEHSNTVMKPLPAGGFFSDDGPRATRPVCKKPTSRKPDIIAP